MSAIFREEIIKSMKFLSLLRWLRFRYVGASENRTYLFSQRTVDAIFQHQNYHHVLTCVQGLMCLCMWAVGWVTQFISLGSNTLSVGPDKRDFVTVWLCVIVLLWEFVIDCPEIFQKLKRLTHLLECDTSWNHALGYLLW